MSFSHTFASKELIHFKGSWSGSAKIDFNDGTALDCQIGKLSLEIKKKLFKKDKFIVNKSYLYCPVNDEGGSSMFGLLQADLSIDDNSLIGSDWDGVVNSKLIELESYEGNTASFEILSDGSLYFKYEVQFYEGVISGVLFKD